MPIKDDDDDPKPQVEYIPPPRPGGKQWQQIGDDWDQLSGKHRIQNPISRKRSPPSQAAHEKAKALLQRSRDRITALRRNRQVQPSESEKIVNKFNERIEKQIDRLIDMAAERLEQKVEEGLDYLFQTKRRK